MTTVTELLEGVARHKLSVDDFHRMAEAGILKYEDRVELIEGEIIDMTPIGSGHAGKTNRFAFVFARAAMEGLAVVSIQNPLRLDLYNEPEPDVMLLRPRKDFYETSHPTAADVLLLVEVADTSLAFDRGLKLALYARHRIPEIWIVNIPGATTEIYRAPTEQGYSSKADLTKGTVSPELLPSLIVNSEDLF